MDLAASQQNLVLKNRKIMDKQMDAIKSRGIREMQVSDEVILGESTNRSTRGSAAVQF